jgi:hypothetical protein
MVNPTASEKRHYESEKTTAELVKTCFNAKNMTKKLTPNYLYNLCRLTWWDKWKKARLNRNADAIWRIFHKDCTFNEPEMSRFSDFKIYRRCELTNGIVSLLTDDTGIVNFYKAFRNSAYTWIEKNFKKISPLVIRTATLQDDADAREIFEQLEKLPDIPKGNRAKGALSPASLLTPLFACLDPRSRFPIINKRSAVEKLHRKLGIFYQSLPEKHDELIKLYLPAICGVKNSFELDACSETIAKHLQNKNTAISRRTTKRALRTLNYKNDEDKIAVIRKKHKEVVHLHNSMTNRLKDLCKKRKIVIKEEYFDALLVDYNGKKDLLVEVKSDENRSSLRLAVGQLLDYRRGLSQRAKAEPAVLTPSKPDNDSLAYLKDVGVHAMWFNNRNLQRIFSTFGFSL